MEDQFRGRQDLKSYFVTHAIPTEDQFASLIDSTLNQADDGVRKQANAPLEVAAQDPEADQTDAHADVPVLSLYQDFTHDHPDWVLRLNPREGDNHGLGIGNSSGRTDLFIAHKTGQVVIGMGTDKDRDEADRPETRLTDARLQVKGDTRLDGRVDAAGTITIAKQESDNALHVKGDSQFDGAVNLGAGMVVDGELHVKQKTTLDKSVDIGSGKVTVDEDGRVIIAQPASGNALHVGGSSQLDGELHVKENVTLDKNVDIGSGKVTVDDAGKVAIAAPTSGDALHVAGSSQFDGKVTMKDAAVETIAITRDPATLYAGGVPNHLVPSGTIVLWYGAVNSIPTGWVLCNGANGTPNLVGRFVRGGDYHFVKEEAPNIGGSDTVKLDEKNMPAHNHGVQIGDHSHEYRLVSEGNKKRADEGGASDTFTSIVTVGVGGSTFDALVDLKKSNGTTSAASLSSREVSVGKGESFGILPPYFTLLYIMKQ